MTDKETTGTAQAGDEPAQPLQQEPETPALAEEPGYLARTGEAVGDDGSVVPVIGGLPAVEGSAWDVGSPADDRGVDLTNDEADATDPRRT